MDPQIEQSSARVGGPCAPQHRLTARERQRNLRQRLPWRRHRLEQARAEVGDGRHVLVTHLVQRRNRRVAHGHLEAEWQRRRARGPHVVENALKVQAKCLVDTDRVTIRKAEEVAIDAAGFAIARRVAMREVQRVQKAGQVARRREAKRIRPKEGVVYVDRRVVEHLAVVAYRPDDDGVDPQRAVPCDEFARAKDVDATQKMPVVAAVADELRRALHQPR